MHYERHIIRNFPKHYPFWKKIVANLAFFIFGTIIHKRKNALNKEDIRHSKRILQPGDIILIGELHRASHLIIGGPITHATIYLGNSLVVHAIADGVETDHLYDIFCEYDTMIILRSTDSKLAPGNYKKKIKNVLNYALSQLGKPFDFEFETDKKKLYCSELIYNAFENAEISTGIKKSAIAKHLHPLKYVNKHFQIIFLSHNLKLVNGEIACML